jgi:hypothetical protein
MVLRYQMEFAKPNSTRGSRSEEQGDEIPIGLVHLLDRHVLQLEGAGHGCLRLAVGPVVGHAQRHGHAQGRDEQVAVGGVLGVDLAKQLEAETVVDLDQLPLGDAQLPRQLGDGTEGVSTTAPNQ